MPKVLLVIIILLTLQASTCEEEIPGYQIEPSIELLFESYQGAFLTYTESINIKKHLAKNSSLPGIDMNSNSTKFWIHRGSIIDSFTLHYTLKTFYQEQEIWINFDTLYVIESSFSDIDLNYGYGGAVFSSHHNTPRRFLIKE